MEFGLAVTWKDIRTIPIRVYMALMLLGAKQKLLRASVLLGNRRLSGINLFVKIVSLSLNV